MSDVATDDSELEKRARLRTLAAEAGTEKLIDMIVEKDSENADLRRLLDRALKPFAQKSEKIGLEQLVLALERLGEEQRELLKQEEATAREELRKREAEAQTRRARSAATRRPLSANLERVTTVVEPAADERRCGECGEEKTQIGVEKTEYLERVPARMRVRVIERHTYACSDCKSGIVTPAAPVRPLQGGLAHSSVLAEVAVRKFLLHEPLYRIRQAFLLEGVDLAESTLGDWCAYVGDELSPVVKHWEGRVLKAYCIRTDDTGVRVLDKDSDHGVKKGHLWPYLSDEEVVFKYTPSKKADGTRLFLSQASCTYLQSDAAPAYDAVHQRGVLEVGCWMHMRRYFHSAYESGDGRAILPLFLIAQMYAIEEKAEHLNPDSRRKMRAEHTRPLLEKLDPWRAQMEGEAPPKSPLGKALTYLRNQRVALERFLDDGRLSIDNGAVERALRRVAVGRKNWLFFGSDAGAERGAIIYSVIATCVMNRVNPLAYIADVLECLAAGWPARRIGELHPIAWLKQHPDCQLLDALPEMDALPQLRASQETPPP